VLPPPIAPPASVAPEGLNAPVVISLPSPDVRATGVLGRMELSELEGLGELEGLRGIEGLRKIVELMGLGAFGELEGLASRKGTITAAAMTMPASAIAGRR